MRLLLDTHTVLWWLADDPTLSARTRSVIAAPDNLVAVSPVTGWEIAIQRAAGRLKIPGSWPDRVAEFVQLPITLEHAITAGSLPPHHGDPFGRMLVAQAQVEGMTIVTRDPDIQRYQVATLPA